MSGYIYLSQFPPGSVYYGILMPYSEVYVSQSTKGWTVLIAEIKIYAVTAMTCELFGLKLFI